MLLDGTGSSFQLSKLGHGEQSKVTNIWFPNRNEFSKKLHSTLSELWWSRGSPRDKQVDRFKENRVIGIGLVDGIRNISFCQNLGHHIGQLSNVFLGSLGSSLFLSTVQCLGIQLKVLQQFDLEPWTGSAVVKVFSSTSLFQYQHSQNVNCIGNQGFVLSWILRGQSIQQTHATGQDTQVTILEQLCHMRSKLPTRNQFGTSSYQTKKTKSSLLFDIGSG
mmetsp:Transcript_7261/g.17076  ORF Transcript_7261/g.17076 Transcript_7261/m.17076 type:complete len:220 (-) Transcript_7261:916-1575(-)